jgi:hypothetical protein
MIHTMLLAMVLASTLVTTPPSTSGAAQPVSPPAVPAIATPMPTGTAAPAADPALLARAKAAFAQLQAGVVDRAALTTDMNAALTDDKLATVKGAIGNLGTPVGFDQQSTGTQGDSKYALYLVRFANGQKIDFIFAVDSKGLISGMRLAPAQ